MDQVGRFPKFKLNRKLTDKEYATQLKPYAYDNQDNLYLRHNDEYLTTIKINSSYLELTDRCFAKRGSFTFIGLIWLGIGIYITILTILVSAPGYPPVYAIVFGVIMVTLLHLIFYGTAYLLLTSELFNLTHNPIRFDRRNRMVYAFLYNKDVVAVPWGSVFFCTGEGNHLGGAELDLRGHIMAFDGVTVKATFALGCRTHSTNQLKRYWRFINHYMEKGPEELVAKVKLCHPISDQKEPPKWALNILIGEYGLGFYLLFPLMLFSWFCRMLATATSKIPVWPIWVEEQCKIEPDDPFIRDVSTNPPIDYFTNLMKIQWEAAEEDGKIAAEKTKTVTMQGISRQEKTAIAKKAKITTVKNATKKGKTAAGKKATKRS